MEVLFFLAVLAYFLLGCFIAVVTLEDYKLNHSLLFTKWTGFDMALFVGIIFFWLPCLIFLIGYLLWAGIKWIFRK